MNTRPQSRPEAELPEVVACLPTDSLKILDRLIDWLPDQTHPDNSELPIHKDAARLYAALQAAYGQQCAATRRTVPSLPPMQAPLPNIADAEAAIDTALSDALKAVKVLYTMLHKINLPGFAVADEVAASIVYAQKMRTALAATRPAEVGGDRWLPIESASVGAHEVIALISVDGPNGYVTDPWTGWINGDGSYSRWPHEFPPTHWKSLGPRPTKNMGSEAKS